jgi:hypothetical protein
MKRSGFTLLEILLTLALTVVLLGLLGMAVNVHLRLADTGRNTVEEAQSARLVLGQMADDLRDAIPVTQPPSSLGCLQGTRDELQIDISRMPMLEGEAMAAAPRAGASTVFPPGDVRTVAYLLSKPENAESPKLSGLPEQKRGLLRCEWERASLSFAGQQGEQGKLSPAVKVLSPAVESIEFTYLDGTTEYQEWDSVKKGKLPIAVRIALAVRQTRQKPQKSSALEPDKANPLTTYSVLVDLPNARATLDKAIAATSASSRSESQPAGSSGSATGATNPQNLGASPSNASTSEGGSR